MSSKGLPQVVILLVVVVVIYVLAYFFKSLYYRRNADFGTWSDFSQTICLNEEKGCKVKGKALKVRTCTPNSRTGYGCIDSKGNHTFRQETVTVECTPTCYSSVWSSVSSENCRVWDDQDATNLATNQNCRNPPQFTFEKLSRQCQSFDETGGNACVKSDGSLAAVGDSESLILPCDETPDCYAGNWVACPPASNGLSDNCGGIDTDCGRVITTFTPATCLINGEEVSSGNCYGPDDPGPCNRNCFNYPCTTFPAGFSNINTFLNQYLEFFSGASALEPNWNNVVINCGLNPISTTSSQAKFVVDTTIAHGFLIGQYVTISGISGTSIGGIPVNEMNGFRQITAKTATTFTIATISASVLTTTGGGASVVVSQDPEGAALVKQDVLFSFGDVTTVFATNGLGYRVRFRIIPSQAEVANGAFYLLGHLPWNGQTGIVSWTGSALKLSVLPTLNLGETFDDVLPRPNMFKFTAASEPQTLQLYQVPGPVLTPLLCGANCLTISKCSEPITSGTDVCV